MYAESSETVRMVVVLGIIFRQGSLILEHLLEPFS